MSLIVFASLSHRRSNTFSLSYVFKNRQQILKVLHRLHKPKDSPNTVVTALIFTFFCHLWSTRQTLP